jgi:hypothetical protein
LEMLKQCWELHLEVEVKEHKSPFQLQESRGKKN